MGNLKRGLTLDVRQKNVIEKHFTQFENFLPTPQDKALYRRKREQYWAAIEVELGGLDDGQSE